MGRLVVPQALLHKGLGVRHEPGRQHQQLCHRPVESNKVTVNIYSLAAKRYFGLQSNLVEPDANGKTLCDTALARSTSPGGGCRSREREREREKNWVLDGWRCRKQIGIWRRCGIAEARDPT